MLDYLEMPGGGGLESEQVCDELSLFTLFLSQTLFIVWKQSPRVERGGVHMPSITNNYTADRAVLCPCVARCSVSN